MVESVKFPKSFLQEKIENFDECAETFRKYKKKTRCDFTEKIFGICRTKAASDNHAIEIVEGLHSKREHTLHENKCLQRITGLSLSIIIIINIHFNISVQAFLKNKSDTPELDFLLAVARPKKRKSSTQSLLESSKDSISKRKSNLRNQICENVACQEMRSTNEVLKTENDALKQTIEEYEKEIADLKEKLDSSNISELSMQLSQARVKGSQRQILDGSQNKLFKVDRCGAVTKYSASMIMLGLLMLVSMNTPANAIPAILLLAYSSAGFETPNLPRFNFFRRLRFMLIPLNEIYIRQFLAEAIELSISFDETSLGTKMAHALAITVMDQTGSSKVISILEHEERSSRAGGKASIDVNMIIDTMKSICGDETDYRSICQKIKSVLTDNCRSANASNQLLCLKLDEIAPLNSPRKSLKCTVHLCGLLETHSLNRLPLVKPFIKKVAAHFAPPSGLAQDNLFQLWQAKSKSKFLYACGSRFFFHGNNALIAFLEYDTLFQIVSASKGSSNGAKEIFQLMKNPKLKEELAVIAGLSILIRQLWTHLTIKSTRSELASKIDLLNELISKLQSNEASIITFISNANVDDENVRLGREIFLTRHEHDDEMINRLKDIYIHIVSQMQPFLEPFKDVEEGTEQHLIDPTNIPCERVFGLLKYAEKHLLNLQFGLLANHAIAKFNGIDKILDSVNSTELESIHADIPNIEQRLKQQHRDQEANRLESARRERDQVHSLSLSDRSILRF